MGIFWQKGNRVRADTKGVSSQEEDVLRGMMDADSVLLESILSEGQLTKREAMQIPTVSACINHIAGTVSSIPLKLYRQGEGGVEECRHDSRLHLLNSDTRDTLTAMQFWRAILEDYYLGSGAYAYINRRGLEVIGIHYVDEGHVCVVKNEHPIFKDYDIYVQGERYFPFEFLKFLRNTKDGCTSRSIVEENSLIFEVAYQTLKFEKNLVKKGGNKKGFLKSAKKISETAMAKLKEGFRKMYCNNRENVVVLNDGIDFQEASNTSVEMQMNENKASNGEAVSAIFKVPASMLTGNGGKEDRDNYIRICILPLLADLECSLDRNLLTENEKDTMYFAFDTKELTRGAIEERYKAYEIGLKNNFLQVDEVRDKEDLEPIGFEWIRLGLDSVLFNPKTMEIYTPNTNETKDMAMGRLNKGGEKQAGDENKVAEGKEEGGIDGD